jgi:hypothetical protein
MSAWGYRSFDNDEAADWVCDFEEGGVAAVSSALAAVCDLGEDVYLEAPEVSAAIGAAEIVAAALDGDESGLSEHAREAFATHRDALADPRLVQLASRAVGRVLRQSELKDLWQESFEQGRPESKSWFALMDALISRLHSAP